jgi:hypothetical protein
MGLTDLTNKDVTGFYMQLARKAIAYLSHNGCFSVGFVELDVDRVHSTRDEVDARHLHVLAVDAHAHLRLVLGHWEVGVGPLQRAGLGAVRVREHHLAPVRQPLALLEGTLLA